MINRVAFYHNKDSVVTIKDSLLDGNNKSSKISISMPIARKLAVKILVLAQKDN